MSVRAVLIAVAVLVAVAGCTTVFGGADPDIDAARSFDRHPVYWVGEQFEGWDLEHVDVQTGDFVDLIYGTCEVPSGTDGGCPPPLEIQIQPLCVHLTVVARAPIWRRRQVRGAPVGVSDSAPVLFTNRVQVKVYRGQDSDPGLPIRALKALRSLNSVEPVLDEADPIPGPPHAVLAGTRPCRTPA